MKILLMLLLMNSLPAMGSVKSTTSVHIHSTGEVSGHRILLGEIASISSLSPRSEKILSEIDLGESPGDGKVVQFTASDISQKLQSHVDEFKGVQVTIPESIIIRQREKSITATGVKEKIEDIVRSLLPDPTWEYEVSEVTLAQVVESLKITGYQIIAPLNRPKGNFSFELIAQEHAAPRRFWVTAKVKYFARTAILTRQIAAHTRFQPSDLNWERKEVTYLLDIPATKSEVATGLAKMTLMPGTMLLRSHFEREMALKFGEEVDLLAGDEQLLVATKGIAQQNAFIGDTVKVKSLATNKIVDGVVTGRGVVNVRY